MNYEHREVLHHLFEGIKSQDRHKLAQYAIDSGIFKWDNIREDKWVNILKNNVGLALVCPWNKLSINSIHDILTYSLDFCKFVKTDHITEFNWCQVAYRFSSSNAKDVKVAKFLFKSCDIKTFKNEDAIMDLLLNIGKPIFVKMTKEQKDKISVLDFKKLIKKHPALSAYASDEVWDTFSKSEINNFVTGYPAYAKKFMPTQKYRNISKCNYHNVAQKNPEFLEYINPKEIKGYFGRDFIIDFPDILKKHPISAFSLSYDHWRILIKKYPSIVSFLPEDYEQNLVLLKLRTKKK